MSSHPLRMRGLKQGIKELYRKHTAVASFTDAWIETRRKNFTLRRCIVASFTDAWIETDQFLLVHVNRTSHPLRMRGLKQYC